MTQLDRSTLKSTTSSLFADNVTGDIGANDLRTQMNNIADSVLFLSTGYTQAPTSNDDGVDTNGNGAFEIGDVWVDETSDVAYICLDNSSENALWGRVADITGNILGTGDPEATQLAIWESGNTQSGDTRLTWNSGDLVLRGSLNGNIIVNKWTDLSGLTGVFDGQIVEIPDTDTDTHTDPVVGGTVPNSGRFQWIGIDEGWQRISSTVIAKATITETNLGNVRNISSSSDLESLTYGTGLGQVDSGQVIRGPDGEIYDVLASDASGWSRQGTGGDNVRLLLTAPLQASTRWFQAAGDGVTNDDAALARAVAWQEAAPGRSLDGEGLTYLRTTGLTATWIRWYNAGTHLMQADVPVLTATPTLSEHDLAATAGPSATTLDLTGSPLPESPPAGAWCVLRSEGLDPAERDTGDADAAKYIATWVQVGEGSTTTSIALSSPLLASTAISPDSSTRVDAYSTSLNARVIWPQYNEAGICEINGLVIEYEDGHSGAGGWTSTCLDIRGFRHAKIDYSIRRAYSRARIACARPIITAQVAGMPESTSNNQIGYGVSDASFGAQVTIDAQDVRHGYTTSSYSTERAEPNLADIIASAIAVGAEVNGRASGTYSVAPFDTHHGGRHIHMTNITVAGRGQAVSLRGRDATVSHLQMQGCESGIAVLTEASITGDEIEDWTKAKFGEIVGRISTDDVAMTCNKAALTVCGSDIEAPGWQWIASFGGEMELTGAHRFRATAASDPASDVVIDLTHAGSTPWTENVLTLRCDAVIDLSSLPAITDIDIMKVRNDCRVVVKGRIEILLPAGSTYDLKVFGGSLEVQPGGRIDVYVGDTLDASTTS